MSTEASHPKIEEIFQSLQNLTDAMDALTETVNTGLEEIKKAVDLAAQAAAQAPNRTGTTLEKNQQDIYAEILAVQNTLKKLTQE